MLSWGNILKMFNPRLFFAGSTLLLLLFLIFEWNTQDKKQKLERSVELQSDFMPADTINIKNKNLDLYIDLNDGSLRKAYVLEKQERDGLFKTRLMSDDESLRFYFKSSVSGFANSSPFVVESFSDDYLKISADDTSGNTLTKTYYFEDKHILFVEDRLDLSTPTFGTVPFFKTFYRENKKSIDYGVSFSRDHLAYSTSEDVFNDEQLSSVSKREDYLGHWVGYSQKHFVVAVFNDEEQQKLSLYPVDRNGLYRFGLTEDPVIENGQLVSQTKIYIGPKQKDILEVVAPHFKYNLDLGFVYGIGEWFIVLLNFFYGWVGNWGVAIIMLTILFKAVLSPLQIMQINSMVKMRKLQPKLQEIQERHKNDRQKLGMEMMQLYSKEKFNPFAGCFPMIPQIPIFLAMFWVTREAFEFRGESFLWIPDLAESDPFLITPILMGVMMYLSQKMMPKPPQSSQGMQAQIAQQMMVVFPPMITLIFLFMPAGVVIYSVINMALSIIPQVLILGRVEKTSD